MKGQKRNIKYTPLVKFASIVASAILVLNLLPVQGIAEARDEIANFANQQSQEQAQNQGNATNNAPAYNQGQPKETKTPPPAETPASEDANASGNDAGKPEGGEQNGGSGESKPADDDESDLGREDATQAPASTQPSQPSQPAQPSQSEETNQSDEPAQPTEQTQPPANGNVQSPQPAEVAQEPIPSETDLAEYLTEATIEGASVVEGVTNVTEDKAYNVKLVFAERSDLQFADGEEMSFALPEEFAATAEQKALANPVTVRYVDEKGNKQEFSLGKNAWRIDEDNVLHFAWRQTDDGAKDGQAKNNAANFKRLSSLANATFELKVQGTFAPEAESVNFGRGPIELKVAAKQAEKPAEKTEAKPTEKPAEQNAENQQNADKPAADQTKQDEEKKQDEAAPATKTTYTYEDADVRVTATLSDASAISDIAKLRVTPVAQGDEDYDAYLGALNATSPNKAEHSADNTLLYDVAFVLDGEEVQPAEGTVKVSFQFKKAQLANELDAQKRSKVDVTHLPKVDGEPVAEPVDAKVSVEKETADFEAKGFSVYAFSYTVDFTFDGYAYKMPGEGSVMLSSLFVALGINRSVADVAKVKFSNPELLSAVKVDNNWRLTSLKSFTTPEKLTVTMTNGDKYVVDVTSPAANPVSVPATVTQTLAQPAMNAQIGAQAIETNLNNMVSDVSISAPMENGRYKLMPGETYSITMSFAESGDKEFPNDDTPMIYTAPGDFKLPTTNEKTFKIIVTAPDGKQYPVSGNTYKINANNQLEVKFNTSHIYFPRLNESTNARFSMSFDGEFDSDEDTIEFGNNKVVDVDIDQTSKVDANKSASVDLVNKKINYVVAVTSTGHSTNVQINDTIVCKDQSGQSVDGLLKLDRNSFTRNTNKGANAYTDQQISSGDLRGEGNDFNYTIGEMKSGEVVTIKYSAEIDTSKIPTLEGKKQVTIGNNKVQVRSDKQTKPDEAEVNTRIDYSPKLQKDGMTLNEDGNSFKASYTFNGDALVSGGGYTLIDTVGDYLTLDGTTGASVTVYNRDGSVQRETQNYTWGNGGFAKDSNNKKFTYTVPDEDKGKNYKYVVEYEVKIDGTDQALDKPTTVNNTVEYDNDHKSTGTGVITPSDDEKFEFNKRVDNIDYANQRVKWTTTINVPTVGLTKARATITDTLPGTWAPAPTGWVQDELYVISGDSDYHQSVKVTGLLPGESYEIVPASGADGTQSSFALNFRKADTTLGLAGGEHARIVTVSYETTIDPDWLAGAANNSWLQNHTNGVTINNETKTATADIAGVGVTKDSEVAGYRTVNGVKLPVYKYTLLLKNVTKDDNTIKDFFDTELLTPLAPDANGSYPSSMGTLDFSPDYFAWYTTNQNNGTRSTKPVSYIPISEQTGNGPRSGIAISTDYDSMVRDSSTPTGYYPITKISYYLTVKDEAALKKIQNRAVNNADDGDDDKTYTLTNQAEWGGTTDPGNVTYEFPGITKEMLNDSGQPMTQQDLTVEDGEIYANFKLTVNPGGAVINGGNPYDITDTIDHLSIDITSINVSPTPGKGEVVYDMSGNELKFLNVPDGQEYVITYRARVIYESTGNTGDTVKVNFKNDVSMLTYEDHISDWAYRKNTGTGAADLYAIKLMKYQAGNMSQKLPGAEFTLYEAKQGDDSSYNNPPTNYVIDTSKPVKDRNGKIVTFTSGGTRKYGLDSSAVDADPSVEGVQEEPGMVTVYGLKGTDGWALEPGKYYFLRETKAPELSQGGTTLNFKLPDYDFQFMISEDGITHYERYIYHSNDTMSAKNYPGKNIHVKKYWGDLKEGGSADNPEDRTYQATDNDVVIVKLQQKIGEGDWSDYIATQGENDRWSRATELTTLTLNKTNNWEGDFKGLPLVVPAGDNFDGEDTNTTYRVIEWKINDKDADKNSTMTDGENEEFAWSYYEQGNTTTITNRPKKGSVKLRKEVQVNGAASNGTLADGIYNFSITGETGTSVASDQKSVSVEVKNGVMTKAVVDGDEDHPLTPGNDGYIEISDFKIGNYTVTEDAPDNGTSLVGNNGQTVVVDGNTGADILQTGNKASFINNVDLGGLKIKKVVAENSDDSVSSQRAKDKLAGTYYFNVYTEQACTNLAKTIDGKNAQLSITIGTDGQAVTSNEIKNLKAGNYWVRETLPEGSVATPVANPVEVTVRKGEAGDVAVIATLTNKYDTGSLNIKKNVTVNGVPAAQTDSKAKTDGTYTFQIWKGNYKGESIQRARVKITFQNGVATSAQYEWTDERTGDEGKTPVWKTDDITVTNGVVTLKGLEPGTYTVHEIENQLPTGMKLVNGNGQGGNDQQVTVTAGDTATIQTAEFTNDCEELGGFEIKKSIITKSPIAAQYMPFNFTITMYTENPVGMTDAQLAGLVDTSIDGNYGEITFHNGVATNIKLVGNEKKTASNLPTGRYYKIVEDSAAGWSLAGITVNDTVQTAAGEATGLITTTESKVEFKNELDEGNLKVQKDVVSNFNQDKTKEFKFKVVLDGYALTGTYGEGDTAMNFTNGAAEFTLKDGQHKEAVKLPANIKYTVTETTEEGFVTKWSDDTGSTNSPSGTITKGTTKTVIATNTREYGDLDLSKSVISTAPGSGAQFTFTVTLSDKSINGEFGSGAGGAKKMTFTNGVAKVTLSNGEHALATGLPTGVTYSVVEASAEGFTQAGVTGNPGKIFSSTTSNVVFTNKHDDGGLMITKNVSSASSTDNDLYFPFKVTLSNSAINGKVNDNNDLYYNNGVAYVFLKNGQQAISAGLDTGITFEVNELNIGNASVRSEVETYLSQAEATHPRPNGLTINQVANLNNYTVEVRDGNNRITNTAGGTIQRGQILTTTSSARYINRHINGELTVSKKLVSDAAADRNKEFDFTIKIYKNTETTDGNVDTSINGVFGDITFVNGVAEHVQIKGNGSAKAAGLPVGLTYTVTENNPNTDGFNLTGITKKIGNADTTPEDAQTNLVTGQVNADGTVVGFENTREKGPLTLSKELISGRAADANQDFTFTVRLSDTSITKEYAATYTPAKDPAETKVKFTQGVATINLKGSQSVQIDGLPTEVYYSVTEAGTPGFRMTGVTKSENGGTAAAVTGAVEGVIVDDPGDEITYQNTRTPGELTVSKKLVSDLPADASKPFDFTVAFDGLTDAAKSAEYQIVYANPQSAGTIQLNNGSASIQLIGGQTATIKGLPTDVTYTVTEASVTDFKITGVTGNGVDVTTDNVVNGKTGTIATTPASVEVTNTRETGKLMVSKKLFSQKTADASKLYTFTVRLGHLEGEAPNQTFVTDDIDKAFSGVTFTDGVGTFTLKGGQSKTIDGLPRGIRYEVTEDNDTDTVRSGVANDGNEANLEAARTQADGAISQTESNALFKNTGKRGGLQGSKTVVGPTAPDQEFIFTLRLAGAAAVNGEGFTDGGATYSYGRYYTNDGDTTGTAISFRNGAASFKIKNGGSFKLENLPLGTRYTLTETSANGFATTVTNGTQVASSSDAVPGDWYYETADGGKVTGTTYVGQVTESTDGGATFAGPEFLNTHEEGNLRIHKVVDSKYTPDTTASYTFRVELSDKNITAVEGDSPTAYITDSGYGKVKGSDSIIPFENGVATFTLGDKGYASITGLPAGTTYTVTETSVEGIETTWTDVVSTDNGANSATKRVGTEGKGTIAANEVATTTATNTRMLGKLDIAKTVISHSAADKETEYAFKVSFYSDKDLQVPTSVRVKYTIDYGLVELVADNTAFRLSDGEVAHFIELPQGIYYKVEETGKYVNKTTEVDIDAGMTTSTKLGQGRTDSGKIDKVTTSHFTNTRIEGGLFVYKNVSSHIESDKQKEFDFRVTLYKEDPTDKSDAELANLIDTSVNGVYGTGENAMNFVGGVATFKLKDGEFRYAMNLKTGLYFRAMEVNDPNFNVATSTSGTKVEQGVITYKENNEDKQWGPSTGEQGQIPNSGNATARITNNRKAGNLKVEKKKKNATTAATDEEFFFTVELSDKTINGTFGDMIFNNGTATFTLKVDQSKSTEETDAATGQVVGTLPVGVRYKVTERNAQGYSTSWESTTYANDTDGKNDHPTTYSYQYNQTWNSSEMSEGLPGYYEGSETRTITWTDNNNVQHTTTAVNTAFPKPTGETNADEEYDGSAHSWTLGDHATEWGWRETDEKGKVKEDSTLQISGITEHDGTPNTDIVTFKNDRQKASIVLYKEVTSGLQSDKEKKFRFHLQLLDSVPAGTYDVTFYKQKVTTSGDTESILYENSKRETVSFDGSVKDFDLYAGDIIVISGLPLGTRYKVTEDVDSDFDSTNMGDTGRAGYGLNGEKLFIADELRNGGLPDTRARSGYDNIRKMGELEVRKTVDSDLQSDKDENAKYTFSIQLNDESYNSVFSMARAVAQKDNFDQDMYYSKTNPDEVLITGYDENVYREDDEGNKEYKPIYDTVNGVRHYSYQVSENDLVQFTDGSATIQLKDGEFAHFYVDNVTGDDAWKPAQGEIALIPYDSANKNYYNFGGLPRGVGYTVTETDSRGLTASWAGTTDANGNATGTISTNALAVADCTNTREGGNLTVSKELVSEAAADKDQVFNFTVRLYSDEQHTKPLALSGKYGDMTFSNGVAVVQILGGSSSTATGLPNDTCYTVTEASATGFSLTGVTVNGTENKKSYTSTTTDDEGQQTTTTEDGSEGRILSTTPSTVVFTNERVTGPLRVAKQLYSMATADRDREFVITVRLDDTSINTKANDGVHGKVGDDKQLVFTNGIATVRLKNGEYASITNLPTGVKYSVNEENASGYLQTQSKVDNNGEQQTSGGDGDMSLLSATMYEIAPESSEVGTVTIMENNRRDLGSFTITKQFAPDKETGEGQTFTFKVKLYTTYVGENDPANVAETGVNTKPNATGTENPPETFGDLEFHNGEATVKLNASNNWSATALNIPTGLYYTIEEQMTDNQKENYRLVNNVGTIQSGQVSNGALIASFTNERIYKGDLTVEKQLVYPGLDSDNDQGFTLKVTLYTDLTKGTVAEDVDKTYATLSTDDVPLGFHDGVATVTLKHDQRASAKELPAGMAYDVEEVANNALQGFVPTTEYKLNGAEDGQHVITEDGLSSAIVTNERETTNASVKKEWHEDNKLAGTKSKIPDSIDVKLMRSDNNTTPYLTVTLNKDNNWTATPETVPELGKLPLKDYNGNDYTYQWDESVDGWTREAIAYSKDNEPQVGVNNAAGYLTTIHNRINVGSLKVTKHVNGAVLSDAEKEAITFTVTDDKGAQVATAKLSEFKTVEGDTDPSWTITGLPAGEYIVTESGANRGEHWTITTTYSVEAGKVEVVTDQTANVQVTNTYRGSLNITKNVTSAGKPTTGTEADGTYKFDVTGPENYKNTVELEVKNGKAATTRLNDLVPGTYTVTEQTPSNGTYLASPNGVQVEVAPEGSATVPTASFTNDKPDKPSFEKKIKDANDSTGVTSDWQDSADYDIGDAVPYKLTATLAQDVTAYKKYHVTFTDKMEDSLDYNKDAQITITGADGKAIDPSTYTVDKVAENAHDFAYKISWASEGDATIADANLNGAKVEVLFTAKLNENAKLGKEGNVNACKLTYSNNPASKDDKDEGELPWDYVIAFTYKLDVSKVDPEAKALEGAEFKLEKKLADGTYKEVALTTAANVFTGTGLDDGTYVLTETKAPNGYKVIAPITFEVTADHNDAWPHTSKAAENPVFDNDGKADSKRLNVLTKLTGKEETGALTLAADDQLAGLAGTVKNTPPDKPSFDKKIKDTNDTTGEESGWQDSADYDIGDAVPYKLAATLASDVTSYKKYHVTFSDKMEDSLTYNKDAEVIVTGADGKAIDQTAYTVEKVAENDHDFAYKVSFASEGDATIADANLNGAKVEVLFTAKLNENAKLGKQGNVNACKLAFSNNPQSADDSDEGELPWDYVIAFTYKLDVSKVDPEAKPLEGAEFKLEKKLADGTTKEVALATDKNVFTGTGLDDGTYVLTETKAPAGYKAADPIEFEVTADHSATWDYTSDATKDPVFDNDGTAGSKRLETLTKLTGNTKSGTLELKADDQLAGLAGNVANQVQGVTAKLAVTKQVLGDEYEGDEEFNFKLEKYTEIRQALGSLAPDTDVLPTVTTAKAKAGETATFDEINYVEDGTYYYSIAEVEPAESDKTDGMIYSTTPNYAIVTVKDNVAEVKYGASIDTSAYKADSAEEAVKKLADAIADGSYTEQVKDDKLTITNYYTAPVEGQITVRKSVVSTRAEDRTKSYGFKMTLYSDTAHTKVAEDVSGTYGDMEFRNGVATFTLTASESKTAKDLPYNSEDTISYGVEEIDSGGLVSNITGTKASNGKSATVLCTNTYTPPTTRTTTSTPTRTTTSTTIPRTSDDTNWIPVAILAVAGVGIVAFALIRRRRTQQ